MIDHANDQIKRRITYVLNCLLAKKRKISDISKGTTTKVTYNVNGKTT